MAETTILVCDVCGAPATESAVLEVGGRRLRKDYCRTHLSELVRGARAVGRGRPRGAKTGTAKRTGAPARASRSRRRARGTSPRAIGADVAAEVTKLKGAGMSYRQIGQALMDRGIKPPRAKAWNPIVLARLVKRPSVG